MKSLIPQHSWGIRLFIQDILDDWNGDCEFVPSNDACVFYTEWNGRPINPAGYTDFGTLIEYLKGLQKRESGV